MTTIVLPWPPSILNPNTRKHWAPVSQAKRKYRALCHQDALAQGIRATKAQTAHIHLDFHPPDNRRRDDDNMVSAFKAGRDGLADCLGLDDAKWTTTHTVTRDKAGCVIVTISLDPEVIELPVKGVIG